MIPNKVEGSWFRNKKVGGYQIGPSNQKVEAIKAYWDNKMLVLIGIRLRLA